MTDTTPKPTAAAKTKAPAKTTPADVWAALAAPFPGEQIEKLPKVLDRTDQRKARCEDTPAGRTVSVDGHFCNGWHSRAVHLDYVGHAGITTRLNDVLGPGGWTFEPYAETPEGLPLMGREFWARLTITVLDEAPVTKWDLAANFNGPQEAYGDALRRCAMRFGVGTYLWSKSEAAANTAIAAHEQRVADKERATKAQHNANAAAKATAATTTGENFDRALAAAREEGLDQVTVKLPNGDEATLEDAIEHHRARVEAQRQAAPPQDAPQTAQQPAPAPEAQQVPAEPQQPAQAAPAPDAAGDAAELAIEALNSDDADYIIGIYRASSDLMPLDVRAVLTEDDLGVLGIPADTATAPLGKVLMTVGHYVREHATSVRAASWPPAPTGPQDQQPDPWADQAAAGWPPVAGPQ